VEFLVVGLNYPPEPTGIAPYTAAFCRGLVARGHSVRVLTTMPHYPEWKFRAGFRGWSRRDRLEGVCVHRLRHYLPSRPNGVRRLLSEISFGLRAIGTRWGRPDIVVFVSPALFSTALGMMKARLRRLPSVVWVQDLYSLGIVETAGGTSVGVVARLIATAESTVLRGASGVCVIHDRFAVTAHQLGASANSIQVVRNWTHLSPVTHGSREALREHLGWNDGSVIALHSGAMGRKQDLKNVVAAARLAALRGERVRFVLMGNGGERERLEIAAASLSTVEFVDPLPGAEYQRALYAADVLIVNEHPDLREMAVPSKLTSYFSSSRPIVAATDPESVTASEIAASGAGVRVDPGDPGALLDAVLALHRDPERAAELGRRGQAYRDSVLSEDAAIDNYANWLATLPSGRRGAGRTLRTQSGRC
jgi:colanic acid biosynthesis glycosyl transferase WcaI